MTGREARIAWCGGLLVLFLAAWPATAADDTGLERLATCRDSWMDWQKHNDPQLAPLAAHLRADFSQKPGEPFLVPKTPVTLAGLRVLQVFPQSVGMGVGFSLTVGAPFDRAKAVFEKKLGKPLQHCETGDGMRSCDLAIADQRTFMLMASDKPGDATTLVGCYYYYEK